MQVFDAIDADAPRPSLDDVSGVVMFGSAYNVDDTDRHPFLKEIRDLTREAVERGMPYLGICLGAQVLARRSTGRCRAAPVKEVGFERCTRRRPPTGLLSHYAEGDLVFQWHQDTFELPEGAELLATGDAVALQAYRVGDVTWGIQWHFEIDRERDRDLARRFSAEADLLGVGQDARRSARGRCSTADHEAKGVETFRRFAEVVRERS